MKRILLAIVLASVSITAARVAHSETEEQAVNKARQRFRIREAKKKRREAIKAKYKDQIEAIRMKQQYEIDGIVPCTTDADCAEKNPQIAD